MKMNLQIFLEYFQLSIAVRGMRKRNRQGRIERDWIIELIKIYFGVFPSALLPKRADRETAIHTFQAKTAVGHFSDIFPRKSFTG